MFKTINTVDGYNNPIEITINVDVISYIEVLGGDPTANGSAGIHIHGEVWVPTDKSYNDVKTALSAGAL